MKTKIKGIIPPIVTPLDADGAVHEKMLRDNIHFQLSRGVHGICFGGSTGEGHTLTSDELEHIAEICVEEAGGRVPVLAGIITNSTRDAAQKAKRMAACGVDALQITPVHYLFKPDDDATFRHFATLGDATDLPIIIYNVIAWNYISPALLVRMMHDIANVKGVKQSAGDLKLMADLLVSAPDDAIVLSAVDALLYPSFALGAHGTIAANPAALPGVCVALWDAVQAGNHQLANEIHVALLRFWNTISADNLPANVKHALEVQGVPSGLPRAPMPPTSAEQALRIKAQLQQVLIYDRHAAATAA